MKKAKEILKKDKYSQVQNFRYEIGANILILMQANDDLPVGNVHRLAKIMQEYFISEGKIDDVKAAGWKWMPDEDYWVRSIGSITEWMRKKLFFGFYREMNGKNGFSGQWCFMQKAKWESTLKFDHNSIKTRIENQNEKIEDTTKKWERIATPKLIEAPALLN